MSRENIGNETACSKKREIRPLTQQDIEAYLDIYLNSYPAYKSLDAECRQHYREKHQLELREDREVQTVGLFEDGILIATMKLVSFSMNFFGKMQPACGLMALEVHPLHKKKGAALEMVRYFEAYAKENGALLTLLLPFKIGFYRQMGYGFAGKLYEYHLPTAVLPEMEDRARQHLRLMQPEDFDEALACYNRFAARNHGMVKKFEEEVRGSQDDIQVRRIGYYADAAAGNACTDGAAAADGACRACEAAQADTDRRDGQPRLRGYVAYRFESASETNYTQNRLSVEELIYDSGEVLRALLGALKMQEDLAQTVILRTGEENFHHLLSDPQDISKNYIDFGFLQTNVSAVGTMFKIVEPEAFIQKTAYRVFPSGSLTAEFCYFDEMRYAEQKIRIRFAEGRWSFTEAGRAAGEDEKNTAGAKDLETVEEPVDITVHCSQGEFASLLMGSADLGALVRLGAVSVHAGNAGGGRNAEQADAVRMLTQMLYCSQKPWLNADY